MKKTDLVKRVVKQDGGAAGDAADRVDRAVDQVIRALRRGEPARLPGLGTLKPGKSGEVWTFRQEKS